MMSAPKLEVIQASDGEEAWRLAREHLPDLVVLDVMMPGMSGWEVCRKIREDVALAHTGVVMLTGIGENLNQMTSPLYGADAFIDKPFEFEDFDGKIRSTLDARTSQREGVVRPAINGTVGAARPLSDEDEGDSVLLSDRTPGAVRGKKAVKKKSAAKKAAVKKKTAAKKTAGIKPKAKKTTKKSSSKKSLTKKTSKKTAAKKSASKPKKKAAAKKTAKKKTKKR